MEWAVGKIKGLCNGGFGQRAYKNLSSFWLFSIVFRQGKGTGKKNKIGIK